MKYYLSAKDITEAYSIGIKSARNIINEIREQVEIGRYPEMSILDGCGVRVRDTVVTDYMAHRKALKNAIARNYVEEYREEEV